MAVVGAAGATGATDARGWAGRSAAVLPGHCICVLSWHGRAQVVDEVVFHPNSPVSWCLGCVTSPSASVLAGATCRSRVRVLTLAAFRPPNHLAIPATQQPTCDPPRIVTARNRPCCTLAHAIACQAHLRPHQKTIGQYHRSV
jgi:hypothetical protein